MRGLLAAVAAVGLALAPSVTLADDWPQQAIITAGPGSQDWLALLTLEGRWAVQVGDGCPQITSGMGMNIVLSDSPEADDATLTVPDGAEFGAGQSCPITARLFQSETPCETHHGVCDVRY